MSPSRHVLGLLLLLCAASTGRAVPLGLRRLTRMTTTATTTRKPPGSNTIPRKNAVHVIDEDEQMQV